jgi:alpha-tubulin suppressor-like RCC1 family protein
MEEKLESNTKSLWETNFPVLKDTIIDPHINAYALRSFSCTSRFFSSSLKEAMKQKPVWQIIAGYEQTFLLNRQTGELYGIGLNEYYSLGINIYPVNLVNKILLSEQIVPFELFVGARQSFILSKEGALYGTGRNSTLAI